jgi:hypothetical protein
MGWSYNIPAAAKTPLRAGEIVAGETYSSSVTGRSARRHQFSQARLIV